MERREFITLLGSAAVAWPVSAWAQQPGQPVIGYLSSGIRTGCASCSGTPPVLGPADLADAGVAGRDRASIFAEGLAETGYIEDRNVKIEHRWAEGHYDRLPELASELVQRRVNVLVAADGLVTAQAAKAATTTIPIVFGIGTDPVESGLVASFARPGGNLTGAARLSSELEPKRLQLLHELIPAARTIALLVNPSNPGAESLAKALQTAARTLGLSLPVLRARTNPDLDAAFAALAGLRAEGIVISPDSFFVQQSPRLAALALRHAIPAMFQYREFAAAGGLISYAASRTESYRVLGVYTGRILKGEKPADLPIQQPTTLELIINLNAARALGLSVPLTVLARANEVIE
jgi:putative ABC transport system substrate-binding protein